MNKPNGIFLAIPQEASQFQASVAMELLTKAPKLELDEEVIRRFAWFRSCRITRLCWLSLRPLQETSF